MTEPLHFKIVNTPASHFPTIWGDKQNSNIKNYVPTICGDKQNMPKEIDRDVGIVSRKGKE